MNFTVDKENKKIRMEREFAAPVEQVWAAWTESALLDQWWAPKPWKAETKIMDFKEGGRWVYAMVGPDGTKHWALAEYLKINSVKSFTAEDAFCDENGKINEKMPRSHWYTTFSEKSGKTVVNAEITYNELSQLETIIQMGFKEGISSAMEGLDELLQK